MVYNLRLFVLACLLIGISESVSGRKYLFATENFSRQNFEYKWRVFVFSNIDLLDFGSNSLTSENITMPNEKLINATWTFELENDQYGVLLYATYSRPSPFYACSRDYKTWDNPWDLILANVSVSLGGDISWLPRKISTKTQGEDELDLYDIESTPSGGCRKIRRNVLRWSSLTGELDELTRGQMLSGGEDILEINFNFLFISQKNNAELIEKYNAPYSDKSLLDYRALYSEQLED